MTATRDSRVRHIYRRAEAAGLRAALMRDGTLELRDDNHGVVHRGPLDAIEAYLGGQYLDGRARITLPVPPAWAPLIDD